MDSFLQLQSASKVVIHPVVVLSILDHYVRRNDGQDRAIGTLLGIQKDNRFEIRNCFPVPLKEDGEIEFNSEFHASMFDLLSQANPNEVVLGWYTTGSDIEENSALIHQYYSSITNTPILLTVDTKVENGKVGVRAFVSTPLGIVGDSVQSFGHEFSQVSHEYELSDTEPSAICDMMKAKEEPVAITPDLYTLKQSFESIVSMLDQLSTYLDKVKNGEITPSRDVSKKLATALTTIPRIDITELETMFNRSLEDMLTITYLANLTRTQLKVSEKILQP